MRARIIFHLAIASLGAGPVAFPASAAALEEREAPGQELEFDFDLFGDTPAHVQEDPSLAERAALRRGMLQAHQIAGLTTLGLMTATVILGQLNFDDLFSDSGAGSGAYSTPHRLAAFGTAGAFAITGGLAFLAPVPYEKEGGFDAGTVHKIAAVGATAGLAGQIALGLVAGDALRSGQADRLERTADLHRITGFVTLTLLLTAASAWIF